MPSFAINADRDQLVTDQLGATFGDRILKREQHRQALVAAATDALGTGVVTITGSARRLVLTGSVTLANGLLVNAPTGAADGGAIHYDGPGRGIIAGGTITITPMTPVPNPAEFSAKVEDVMKRYAQTMKRLA